MKLTERATDILVNNDKFIPVRKPSTLIILECLRSSKIV